MKNIVKNILLISGLLSLLSLNSCKESLDPVIEELNYNRTFAPVGLEALISNVTTVTLSWSQVKNIDHFVVEIYEGTNFDVAALVHTEDISGDKTSYSYVLPAGDTQFSARLKGISSLEGVNESKWAYIAFKTAPENLFTGYKSDLTGLGSLTVRWKPGAVATALLFDDGVTETPYTLTPQEITAGVKDLTSVPNAKYEIRLMNGTFSRGKINFTVEGDVLLEAGGDLTAAITALPAGGVIILRNGENFGFTGDFTLTKSIKIRGLANNNLPTIYPTSGNRYFILDPALTLSDSLVFENLNLSGFINLDPLTRVRGVLDQESTAAYVCAIGSVKFNNCNILGIARSIIRLRGVTGNQIINNVEINNCLIYDAAFGSGNNYALIHSSAATATINNILIKNSTVNHCRHSLVLYTAGTNCDGINLENCTFNDFARDSASTRYAIDLNTTVFSTGSGLSIKNCIFGSTPYPCSGVRIVTGTTMTITRSYYTSDYDDGSTTSIKTFMEAYTGTSTALWTDQVHNDFSFLDLGFAGNEVGDPRWY